jgi:ribose-phosphate pyrophosphokinase
MGRLSEKNRKYFITPEWFARDQRRRMEPPRGKLLIASCRSGNHLSAEVVRRYQQLLRESESSDKVLHMANIDQQFSDSETCVRLDQHVGGFDVFLFQALYDPTCGRSIDQNYMAFLTAVRTFREHGVNRITGVLPYLAYARQDKPTKFTREPTTAKLMADLSIEAGLDRLISWDPHSTQIHGFYGQTPLNLLDPLTLFTRAFKAYKNRDDVVAVAPDVGASKFVTHFSRTMKINSAIASKYRPKPEKVITTEIIGDLENKRIAIVLDDIMSSGNTIYAVVKKLVTEKKIKEVYVGVSHNLCTDSAFEYMSELHDRYRLRELIVTNTIPQTSKFKERTFLKIYNLADVLSLTINRIHYNRSVSELFYES